MHPGDQLNWNTLYYTTRERWHFHHHRDSESVNAEWFHNPLKWTAGRRRVLLSPSSHLWLMSLRRDSKLGGIQVTNAHGRRRLAFPNPPTNELQSYLARLDFVLRNMPRDSKYFALNCEGAAGRQRANERVSRRVRGAYVGKFRCLFKTHRSILLMVLKSCREVTVELQNGVWER